MLPPIKEPRKPLVFPRWAEWVLAAAMLFLAYLEYKHGENFWAGFFVIGALLMMLMAAGVFGRPQKDDAGGK